MAIGRPPFFEEADLTLTGDQTLSISDTNRLLVTASGTNRNLTLPAADSSVWDSGVECFLTNVGSSNNVVVKNPDATTLDTLEPGEYGRYYNSNGTWYIGDSSNTGTTDTDAIHDNVAAEISAVTAKTELVDADEILVEDSEDSYNKKSATIADIRMALNADQWSALSQSVLDDCTTADNFTATKADVAPASSGGVVSAGLANDENDVGSNLIWTNPGSVDMSASGIIKISNLKFDSTNLSNYEVWVQDASGTNHTKWRCHSMIKDEAFDLYLTLEDATDVTKIIFQQTFQSATSNTNTVTVSLSQIENPAMPKWWAAAVSATNASVLIPKGYSDAVSDPQGILTPPTVTVIDERDSTAAVQIWPNDGTKRQLMGMPATFGTDVFQGLVFLAGWLYMNPGSRVLMPEIPGWELTGGYKDDDKGSVKFGDHHTTIDWNGLCLWASSPARVAKNIVFDYDASHWHWKNLKSYGHSHFSTHLGDDGTILDIGGSAAASAEVNLNTGLQWVTADGETKIFKMQASGGGDHGKGRIYNLEDNGTDIRFRPDITDPTEMNNEAQNGNGVRYWWWGDKDGDGYDTVYYYSVNNSNAARDPDTRTMRGGPTVSLPGAGDCYISYEEQNGPVPQSDGRFLVEFEVTVSDSAGTNTDGMEIFVSSESLLSSGQAVTAYNSAENYEWVQSAAVATEYWLRKDDGTEDATQPWTTSIKPDVVRDNGADLTVGTLGSLAQGEFDVGKNDGQTNNTIYVRLTSDNDPNGRTMTVSDGEYAHFGHDFDPNLAQLTDRLIRLFNRTTGATTVMRGDPSGRSVRGYNVNIFRQWSGGSRSTFDSDDTIDFLDTPYQEIYVSGTLQVDAQGRPVTKLTPTSGATTYTIKAELPRNYWYGTRVHVRNLNGSSTLTVHDVVVKNSVGYNEEWDKATALTVFEANNGVFENFEGACVHSDGFHVNGERAANISLLDSRLRFNRRQGTAITQGRNITYNRVEITAASRALVDIEPSARQAEGITMIDIRGGGQDGNNNPSGTRIGNTMTCSIASRHHVSYFDQLNFVLKPAPGQNPNGMTQFASAPHRDYTGPSMQIGSLVTYDDGTVIISGKGVSLDSVTCHAFQFDSSSSYCTVNNLTILARTALTFSTNIGTYYEDRGTSNALLNYNELGDNQITEASGNNAVDNAEPINIASATTPRIGQLALTFLYLNYPGEYVNSLVQVTTPFFMGGLNGYDGQIYGFKSLASSAARRDGQNMMNKTGTSAGNSYQIGGEYEGAVRAVFPLNHDRTFDTPTAFVNGSATYVHGDGDLSASTQYFYNVLPKTRRHYGPYHTGVTLSPTLGVSDDSVRLIINRPAPNTGAFRFPVVHRGDASGVYTHRYELYPALDTFGDLARAQDHTMVDTGTALLYSYPGSWTSLTGWTASTGDAGAYYHTSTLSDTPQEVAVDVSGTYTVLTEGTIGSLANGEWAVGDVDSIGANRLYVQTSAGDPTGSTVEYTNSSFPGLDMAASATTGQVPGTPDPFTVTANSGFVKASDGTTDPWALSTTSITVSGVDLSDYDIKPGYRVTWDAGTATAALQSQSYTIKEVWPTAIVVDAAMAAAPAAGDEFRIYYEWGTGGYQDSGGVPTYAADQMNDERGWEPNANYQVLLPDPKLTVPTATHAAVTRRTYRWDWQVVVLYFGSGGSGNQLISPSSGNAWQDIAIVSGG